MSEGPIHHVRIDDNLDSYRSFFDHDWAKQIDALVRGTKLEGPVFTLGMTWKSVANTHFMPWLLVVSLIRQLDGFMETNPAMAATVIKDIRANLLHAVEDCLSREARRRLTAAINTLSAAAVLAQHDVKGAVRARLSPEVHWNELLKNPEFKFSIWGSQRICYGALYHAFEYFARQCVAIGSGQSDEWRLPGNIVEAAKRLYGPEFVDKCLGDRAVTIARFVRNALAHQGGRVTSELEGIGHGMVVEDGEIQIMPDNTAALYNVLKTKAFDLAERTLALGGQNPPKRQ